MEDKIRDNGDLCAKINLDFLEVIKNNETYLINVEEVERVMEGIAKNSGATNQGPSNDSYFGTSMGVLMKWYIFWAFLVVEDFV